MRGFRELALSWNQVDPTNWQFKLREGVQFTDGSEFDAAAAATSLNYVLDAKNAFPMRTFLGVPVRVPMLRSDGSEVEVDLVVRPVSYDDGRRAFVGRFEPV